MPKKYEARVIELAVMHWRLELTYPNGLAVQIPISQAYALKLKDAGMEYSNEMAVEK